jgi:hypothetical protein
MKLTASSFFIIPLLTLLGCGPSAEEKKQETLQALNAQIPGTWQITYMRVNMDSFQSTAKDSIFEAREETWENQFQIKPFRMYFDKDKKYHQTFRGRDNSLISEYYGIWKLTSDTLTLIQSDQTLEYKIVIEDGQILMTSLIDWDGDRVEDDTYYAKQRLISKRSVE